MITPVHLASLPKHGITARYYRVGRSCGASHDEVIEAYEQGIGLFRYAADRRTGLAHAQVIEQFNIENPRRGVSAA